MGKIIDFIKNRLIGELRSLELPERSEFLFTLFIVVMAVIILSLFFSLCTYVITSFFKMIKIV